MSTGPAPSAADRAIAIITSFRLSDEDDEVGEEMFEILDDLGRAIHQAETIEQLEQSCEALSNTVIVLCALIDALIDHCPKDVELSGLAQQLTGSLS